MRFVAGNTSPGGPVSPQVAALTKSVLRSLRLDLLKPLAAVGLALGLIVLVTCLLLFRRSGQPTNAAPEDDTKTPEVQREETDQEKLQGDWKMERVMMDGKPKDPMAGTWVFQGDRIIVRFQGGASLPSSFKLDPSQKPKTIDVTFLDEKGNPRGQPLTWIYELNGDTFKTCSYPNGGEGRPKEIASKPRSGMMVMVFKRQPANSGKDRPKK
jgi:uncharacterized protein (TIGR03067 family)